MKETAKAFAGNLKRTLVLRGKVHQSVADDIVMINLKRLIVIAAITVPFSVLHIIFFHRGIADLGGPERTWRMWIITCHLALLVCMGSLGFIAFRLRKLDVVTKSGRALQYLAVGVMLAFGIVIASVDQLVTPNITPFLVACTILSASLLIKPHYMLPIYAVGLGVFVLFQGFTQQDHSVLLNNRMNGLAAIGIAIFLSYTLWNSTVATVLQKRKIESQQKELEEKNNELQVLVSHDPLTNLLTRRRFEELMTTEIAMVRRYGQQSSLVMLDVDGFKLINDNFGHLAGDSVVRHVASILKANVRETDTVARWGGDEFIILLPCTGLMDGKAAAEKLGAAIRQSPLTYDGELLNVTASFGVTAVSCTSENSLEQTFKDADLALYMAKGRGRDCVAVI